MSETASSAVATIDSLLGEIQVEIDRILGIDGADRTILLMLGREADGYMALREMLTGERRQAVAH